MEQFVFEEYSRMYQLPPLGYFETEEKLNLMIPR